MAIDFPSPSMRAAGGDLAIQVSPLGLIDISDEEFEVHGPRIIRYSNNWAWYLGHHWAYRAQAGEPQLTFNHVKALVNFAVNFSFGKGFSFLVDPMYQHIVPALLDRVFSKDNNRAKFFWGLGQQGKVSGDVFVKVAYAQPGTDAADPITGRGRVTLLNLQPSHCFPEWHPHIPGKLTKFKLKYKFWGTAPDGTRLVNTYVEEITEEYIKEWVNDELIRENPNPLGVIPIVHIANMPVQGSPWGLSDIDDVIPLNREYNEKATEVSDILNYHACVDEVTEVLTTNGWRHHTDVSDGDLILARDPETDEVSWKPATFNRFDYSGNLVHWTNRIDAMTTPNHRWLTEARVGRERKFVREVARTSEAVDGDRKVADLQQASRVIVGGGEMAFPAPTLDDKLVDLVGWWITEGCLTRLPSGRYAGVVHQSVTANPGKVEELRLLAKEWQAAGHKFTEQKVRESGVIGWYLGTSVVDALENIVPNKSLPPEFLTLLSREQAERLHRILIDADGTRAGIRETFYQDDRSRVDGFQMLAAMLGIRTNFYEDARGNGVTNAYFRPHILAKETTDTATEEAYEGTVWCPTVAGGFWFARRNGKTYWTGNSPVTVITGGKPPNLEKGPAKIWGIMNDKAQVFNLEGGAAGLPQALEYLEMLRMRMHEYGHVPANALGEPQPISNTSGVALAIQYMPTMQWHDLMRVQYGDGLKEICQLILKTLFFYEPEAVQYDPTTEGIMDVELGQQPVIDPDDPAIYDIDIEWPPPLPVDKLIILEEIGQKLAMNLESRKGALRSLNEEFPDEKLEELRAELMQDAKWDAELKMYKSTVDSVIMSLTGVIPEGESEPVPPEKPEPGANAGNANAPQQVTARTPKLPDELVRMQQEVFEEIVTNSFMPRVPIRRTPARNDNDNNDVV